MFSLNSFIMKVLEIGIATNKSMIKYIVFLSFGIYARLVGAKCMRVRDLDPADSYTMFLLFSLSFALLLTMAPTITTSDVSGWARGPL